jgi:hypothetical protein
MIWIFASVVLALAVYHEGFRKVLFAMLGIAGVILIFVVVAEFPPRH